MIRNLVLYFIFPSLIIAFVLSFAGVTQVASGEGFRLWIKYVNSQFSRWSFEIPKVKDIPLIEQQNNYELVKSVHRVVTTPVISGGGIGQRVTAILNFLITVVNVFIKLLNVIIIIINVLLQVIQFCLTIIWCIKDIPTYVRLYESGTSIWWFQNVGV